MKKCVDCGLEKDLSEFHLEKRNKDGHRNNCKVCRLKRDREKYASRDIETKASKIFAGIIQRCTNDKRQEDRPHYKIIGNKLNKEEFIKWYIKNHFDGCEVDRIDNDGHYGMSNIQLLTKAQHNQKRASERICLTSNTAKCTLCNRELDYSLINFYKEEKLVSKYNPLGIRSRCKECDKTIKIKEDNAI